MKGKLKSIIEFIIILVCLLAGMYFAKFYQPTEKTLNTYREALKDYNQENYQNSYYLFSKIHYFSPLKPVALYRQAMCAKALGDERSLLYAYQNLFKKFPMNKLALESKYHAATLLKKDNHKLAKKYFEDVIKSKNVEEDYIVASKFHLAGLLENSKNSKDIDNIKNFYAYYLEKYPDGKFSDDAATALEKFKPELSSEQYTLIARTYFLEKKSDKALDIFPQTSLKDSWALRAQNSFELKNYDNAKFLTELGVAHYLDTVDEKDFKKAIKQYLIINSKDKYQAISNLLKISKGERKDYIWYLKCDYTQGQEKSKCYKEIVKTFPKSTYTQKILERLFFSYVNNHDYEKAYEIGKSYCVNFDNPELLFWQGKIAQNISKPSESQKYFKDVIKKFPDSYWAYRAFVLSDGAMNTDIEYKPIKYPYKTEFEGRMIKTLEKVGDYEMITKITNDEFIKSWALYKQNKYSTSMLTAKNAMDKLKNKPPLTDLRWRLVYPLHYYKEIEKYSSKYGNQPAMIYGITREESYFNTNAGSSVGAKGLMQLMDATAIETARNNGIPFQIPDLFKPEINIELGNIYFAQLRKMLDDMEISTVAAYNGGIGSVLSWKKNLSYADSDDFVEKIPYQETKDYVKKVLRSYWNYSRIYNN